MSKMAISKEVDGTVDQMIEKVTEAIKPAGFGILTRIDFDQKMKEKLNQTIDRCVILGACNPALAFEAFQQTTDVALLVPCNVVVRESGPGKVIVEAIRPSAMLEFLPKVETSEAIKKAEAALENAIQSL